MMPTDAKNPELSPLELYQGKHVMLIGTTGFLAKVMLGMLLERFSVGRIYCMIRPTKSKTAEDRFNEDVLGSPMMEPIRRRFGKSFDAYVRDQCEAVAGDLAKPDLGLEPRTFERLKEKLDLVINSAGLVNFNPPLDNAIDANTIGAREVALFASKLRHPRLIHVSTCFVAGSRSGRIREDAPILGYFPREGELKGATFDWKRELRDLERQIQQVKARTDDAALEATFRSEALERLKKERREPHERTVRAAITNQRRRWVQEELIRVGKERAAQWGWPNIYTYSKALGEQAVASTEGLDWAIVRPAVVESSMSYPFPGWNEGMNTSAPLAWMGIQGQVVYPGSTELILDVIPVDYVGSVTLAAGAALIAGETKKVYQAATGELNPCSMARVVTLVGLYKRRHFKRLAAEGKIAKWKAELKIRQMPLPMSRTRYEHTGAPAIKQILSRSRKVLDQMAPERYGPFGGWVSRAQKAAKNTELQIGRASEVFDLFMPFIWDNKYVFLSTQSRGLFSRMNPADRSLLPFDPEGINWRTYWLDVHLPGLEKWVFPQMEPSGTKRIPIPRDYRDLAEMFESRTKEHGRRVAFRILKKDDVADSFTYRDVRRAAHAVSHFLKKQGVGRGDRVVLASEGRPEWGMTYFGILLSGATAVPVDIDLSSDELRNIVRAARARGAIASPNLVDKLRNVDKLKSDKANGSHSPSESMPSVWTLDQVFEKAHLVNGEDEAPVVKRKPEDVASIIFTSGTTGKPKGVVLTDRNFTSLTSRMSVLFELNRTDSLLSVLPPHHTFEFSVGLLMPVASGASVTYLEERTPELISRAFEETPVTALVGVPAVWESLHRKISRQIDGKGWVVGSLLRTFMRLNLVVRDRTGWNLGRWVFRPVHNAFGGRLRYLVSGGAPLKPSIFKDMRSLGFSLYEGYGLSEASPVLTVGRPRRLTPPGSVGLPLPGLEVRVHQPDDRGIGEVVARGPTIMQGYLDDEAASKETLRDGWLHTGDQGRLDEEGRLYIVGREKDVIIEASGKNVYPDEIEALYTGHDRIKELSVVGVPASSGSGERVAALVVPNYESGEKSAGPLQKKQVEDSIREHFREVGSRLPFGRRVKTMHFHDHALPRTSTRKVKRAYVRDEILRLERLNQVNKHKDATPHHANEEAKDRVHTRVHRIIAKVSQRNVNEVFGGLSLVDGLSFDSLMQLELLNTLESEFPQARVSADEVASAETVNDIVRLAERCPADEVTRPEEVAGKEEERPLRVPGVVSRVGKSLLGWGQRRSYEKIFGVEIEGEGNIPANTNFIVAANHSSHLDMGLVKHALGPFGEDLTTLAARDYFFDDPLRRVYFENFTNLLPIDRHGSLKKSLRMASDALSRGHSLLIFPEGTRSRDGQMRGFKSAIGYLCLSEQVDILPMHLTGTHEALPVGGALPKQRKLKASIGTPLRAETLLRETKSLPRSQAYRHVAQLAENRIRALGNLPERAPETMPRAKQPRTAPKERITDPKPRRVKASIAPPRGETE